jgi:hypothetical protein
MLVSFPEISFLLDAPQPLEPPSAYYRRSTLESSSLEIDSRAKMGSYRYRKPVVISLQPQQPFLGSQGKYQEIRSARIDGFNDMILAHFADFAEAGIQCSNTTQVTCPSVDLCGSLGRDTFRATEQEDAQPTASTPELKAIEEIGARSSFLDR